MSRAGRPAAPLAPAHASTQPPASHASDLAAAIERLLRARLQPQHLEVHDHSAAHAQHPGSGGKGHFQLRIVSICFEGLTALQRHRLVNETLAPLWREQLHAVSVTAFTPNEFVK